MLLTRSILLLTSLTLQVLPLVTSIAAVLAQTVPVHEQSLVASVYCWTLVSHLCDPSSRWRDDLFRSASRTHSPSSYSSSSLSFSSRPRNGKSTDEHGKISVDIPGALLLCQTMAKVLVTNANVFESASVVLNQVFLKHAWQPTERHAALAKVIVATLGGIIKGNNLAKSVIADGSLLNTLVKVVGWPGYSYVILLGGFSPPSGMHI